jgi:hypothetical protein
MYRAQLITLLMTAVIFMACGAVKAIASGDFCSILTSAQREYIVERRKPAYIDQREKLEAIRQDGLQKLNAVGSLKVRIKEILAETNRVTLLVEPISCSSIPILARILLIKAM